ncbi:MAG TPA: tyrosine--tRNA ligase [Tepidisphaeraceae bacterium]|jgi:tyrosyl-tRNA synthetase|nr:tyrosine--tRNA ligase [Tepidisphaeraceae bacterium]
MPISIDDQIRLLSRRCERILTEEDLRRKLKIGKPLRIKLGMDPTAPDVTLGHAVPLKVIRQFQEFGHKAVLIIGDYTARVGDPSGRNVTRPVLSAEQIDANAKTYVSQIGKILLTDPDHLEVRWNGEWLGAMNLIELIKLASRKSVAQMLDRDSFKERFQAGGDIRIHELLYPLLQGWDSVVIDADVEMGGSDQLFNNLVGREFQKEEGKDPQVVMVTPLLVGTDGQMKMSKSKGNYIGVTDPPAGPEGMFGKVMKLPDHLLENYYTLLTDLPPEQFKPAIAANPRDAKAALAKWIITWLHDAKAASEAEAEFVKTTHGGVPEDMAELPINRGVHHSLAGLLVTANFVKSKSEGFRKIEEGAVRIDGTKCTSRNATIFSPALLQGVQAIIEHPDAIQLSGPAVVQLGNRKFVRLVPSN